VLLVVELALLLSACDREGDGVRAAATEREASWSRRLIVLKAERSALLERARPVIGAAQPQSAGVQRLRAVVDGSGQSLVDVEMQVKQVRARVELALADGTAAGQRTLDEASVQMNGYLDALAADLSATERQVTDNAGKDRGVQ
jgi:hypothetical protein